MLSEERSIGYKLSTSTARCDFSPALVITPLQQASIRCAYEQQNLLLNRSCELNITLFSLLVSIEVHSDVLSQARSLVMATKSGAIALALLVHKLAATIQRKYLVFCSFICNEASMKACHHY